MTLILTRAALGISGAILAGIGLSMLVVPLDFFAMNGVEIPADPSLLSEITAPGVALVLVGVLMLTGSIKLEFAKLGLVEGGLVYGSYGLSRVISMVFHGLPSDSLVTATVIELVVGIILIGLSRVVGRGARQK